MEVKEFKERTRMLFKKISDMDAEEIECLIKEDIKSILEESAIKANIVEIIIAGSRSRGLERENSDLDIVVVLDTTEREDYLFNVLNENEKYIGSVKVDINPITMYQTGTVCAYLEEAERYLERKKNAMTDEMKYELEFKESSYDGEAKKMVLDDAFYHAAKFGKFDEVNKYLLEGADVNYVFRPDEYHTTALHMAAYFANEKMVRLLLENGSEVNTQNIFGKTALDMAKERHGREYIISLLEQHGGVSGAVSIPDVAKVGDVFYTERNTYLVVCDDGKLEEIDEYRITAEKEIEERRSKLKRFGQEAELDFSDGKYESEKIYWGFSLLRENPEAMLRFAEYNLELLQKDKWSECTIPGMTEYDKESCLVRYISFVNAAKRNSALFGEARNLSMEFHSWLEYESAFKDTTEEFYHNIIMNVGDMMRGDFTQSKLYINDNRDFPDLMDENEEFLRESAEAGLNRYEEQYEQMEQKIKQFLKEEEQKRMQHRARHFRGR